VNEPESVLRFKLFQPGYTIPLSAATTR